MLRIIFAFVLLGSSASAQDLLGVANAEIAIDAETPYDDARGFSQMENTAAIAWAQKNGKHTAENFAEMLAPYEERLKYFDVDLRIFYSPNLTYSGLVFGFVDGWSIPETGDYKLLAFIDRIVAERYLLNNHAHSSRIALANRLIDEAIVCPSGAKDEDCSKHERFRWKGSIAVNGVRTIEFKNYTTFRLASCFLGGKDYLKAELENKSPQLLEVGIDPLLLVHEPEYELDGHLCYRVTYDVSIPDSADDSYQGDLLSKAKRLYAVFSEVGGKAIKAAIIDDILK